MSCHFSSENGVEVWVCMPNIYRHNGFLFKWHKHLGVTKLNRDFTPSTHTGKRFMESFCEWLQLSDECKEQSLVSC